MHNHSTISTHHVHVYNRVHVHVYNRVHVVWLSCGITLLIHVHYTCTCTSVHVIFIVYSTFCGYYNSVCASFGAKNGILEEGGC